MGEEGETERGIVFNISPFSFQIISDPISSVSFTPFGPNSRSRNSTKNHDGRGKGESEMGERKEAGL